MYIPPVSTFVSAFNIDFHSYLSLHSTFSEFYAPPIVYFKKEEEKVLKEMTGELHNTFV